MAQYCIISIKKIAGNYKRHGEKVEKYNLRLKEISKSITYPFYALLIGNFDDVIAEADLIDKESIERYNDIHNINNPSKSVISNVSFQPNYSYNINTRQKYLNWEITGFEIGIKRGRKNINSFVKYENTINRLKRQQEANRAKIAALRAENKLRVKGLRDEIKLLNAKNTKLENRLTALNNSIAIANENIKLANKENSKLNRKAEAANSIYDYAYEKGQRDLLTKLGLGM